MSLLIAIAMLQGVPPDNEEAQRQSASLIRLISSGVRAHGEFVTVCGTLDRDAEGEKIKRFSGWWSLGYVHMRIDPQLPRYKRGMNTCVSGRVLRLDGLSREEAVRRWGHRTMSDSATLHGYWISK